MHGKTTPRIWILLLIGGVFGVSLLAGIQLYRPAPMANSALLLPIRMAYQDRIGSAVCIVAAEKGFFQAAGVSVKAFRFNNGPACAEALFSGSVDIAGMGDTTAIIATARHLPLTIIASHGSGEHRHRLMVAQNSSITRIDHLAGKTIGVKMGTSTHGGFLSFLAAHHLSIKDIHLIDMRPQEMTEALLAGSIDAFVASEPTPSLAELHGAREMTTLGNLGNIYPLLVLANNKILEQRPDAIRGLLQALQQAVCFIDEKPAETAAILAKVTGLPIDVVQKSMKLHRYHLMLDETIMASLEDTAGFLKTQGIIEYNLGVKQVTDNRYLP